MLNFKPIPQRGVAAAPVGLGDVRRVPAKLKLTTNLNGRTTAEPSALAEEHMRSLEHATRRRDVDNKLGLMILADTDTKQIAVMSVFSTRAESLIADNDENSQSLIIAHSQNRFKFNFLSPFEIPNGHYDVKLTTMENPLHNDALSPVMIFSLDTRIPDDIVRSRGKNIRRNKSDDDK